MHRPRMRPDGACTRAGQVCRERRPRLRHRGLEYSGGLPPSGLGTAELVGDDVVTAIAIEAKAAARGLAVPGVGADDFGQALKPAEERWCVVAQVHEHLIV